MPTDSVRAVIYPGSFYDSQTDSITGSDYVEYSYDQIGEMTSMTDQNGTTHDYTYLCPCQLGVTDFVRPVCWRGSQGTGRFNFAHSSMAA